MDNTTLAIIAAVVGAVVILAIIAGLYFYSRSKRQSKDLKHQFGPEYDRTVEETGDKKKAEQELLWRRQRVARYELRPLTVAERNEFTDAWKRAESRFVDEPSQALNEADRLLIEITKAHGYRSEGTDQLQADLSVHHPDRVDSYRFARHTVVGNERGDASTESLREAMMHFRYVFEELIDDEHKTAPAGQQEVSAR